MILKDKIKNFDSKYPWIKYVIGGCLIYASWRFGYHYGCKDTAEAEVVYIKENHPEAYDIIINNLSNK